LARACETWVSAVRRDMRAAGRSLDWRAVRPPVAPPGARSWSARPSRTADGPAFLRCRRAPRRRAAWPGRGRIGAWHPGRRNRPAPGAAAPWRLTCGRRAPATPRCPHAAWLAQRGLLHALEWSPRPGERHSRRPLVRSPSDARRAGGIHSGWRWRAGREQVAACVPGPAGLPARRAGPEVVPGRETPASAEPPRRSPMRRPAAQAPAPRCRCSLWLRSGSIVHDAVVAPAGAGAAGAGAVPGEHLRGGTYGHPRIGPVGCLRAGARRSGGPVIVTAWGCWRI
jgi:hypothetical protein